MFERYNVLLTVGELEMLWAVVVSIFLIGGILGSLCGSWISDNYGRFVKKIPSILVRYFVNGIVSRSLMFGLIRQD